VPNPVAFDDLPLRFRAVTADIETGEAVIPEKGDLAQIVRASMSVPGFFSPVALDGRTLVDGGITNNLPVDEALRLGADVLIVVELYADLKKSAELTNPLSITGQIVSILLAQNSALQRRLMRKKDVLIEPDIKGFSSTDFGKSEELRARGYAAAAKLVPVLKKLSVTDERYRTYQAARARVMGSPATIEFVKIENDSEIPDKLITSLLSFKAGDPFDRGIVEKDVEKIYNWGFFSSVSYSFVNEQGSEGVVLKVRKKSWYSDYMRIGAAIEDDFEGDSDYRLALSYRKTNVNRYGAYADFDAEIGRTPGFSAELYQPFAPGNPFFFAPQVSIERNQMLLRHEGDTIAEYQRLNGSLSMQVGRRLGGSGESGIGVARGFGEIKRDIGDPELNEFSYDTGDAFARLVFDALDTADFPTSGYRTVLQYRSALDGLGSSSEFDALAGGVAIPFTFGRNTLLLNGDFTTTFDNRPVERSLALGGLLDVSGFERSSLLASDYGIGRFIFYRRFSELKTPLFGLDFFAGASLEFASLRSDVPAIPDEPLIVAGSTFIGIDTPVLPLYFGVGYNDEHEAAIYLALGRTGPQRQ
jgi:NTE family protein